MTAGPNMYICEACGHRSAQWSPRCPIQSCRSFKMRSEISVALSEGAKLFQASQGAPHAAPSDANRVENAPTPPHGGTPPELHNYIHAAQPYAPPTSEPIRITLAEAEIHERVQTQIEPFDRVLGGGLVVGSAILLGGDPGCGKSTLSIQALAGAAGGGARVLYVTGEETIGQATERARRCHALHDGIWIVNETNVDTIIAHARSLRSTLLTIDSIQTCVDLETSGAPGSVAQVKACAGKLVAFAKANDVILILIGHVTKDGAIAGPKTLEHLVDVTFHLDVSEFFKSHRILRAHKNRYGSTQEIGSFEMGAEGMIAIVPELEDTPPLATVGDGELDAPPMTPAGEADGDHLS